MTASCVFPIARQELCHGNAFHCGLVRTDGSYWFWRRIHQEKPTGMEQLLPGTGAIAHVVWQCPRDLVRLPAEFFLTTNPSFATILCIAARQQSLPKWFFISAKVISTFFWSKATSCSLSSGLKTDFLCPFGRGAIRPSRSYSRIQLPILWI